MHYYTGYVEGNEISNIQEGFRDSYQMLNVNLSHPFLKNSLDISIGIKNLLNYMDVFSYGSTGDVHSGSSAGDTPVGYGRTFFIKINYNYSIK